MPSTDGKVEPQDEKHPLLQPRGSILPLSADAIAKIKSSISITSLAGVVLELLKNSLDGNATRVDIDVHFGRGSCVVEDDGDGVDPLEFSEAGGLGKLHSELLCFNSWSNHLIGRRDLKV
jgi:hypothetical protein